MFEKQKFKGDIETKNPYRSSYKFDSRYDLNFTPEKEKERRLKYLNENILVYNDILYVKKEEDYIKIKYRNGNIFKIKGWLIENSNLIFFDKEK